MTGSRAGRQIHRDASSRAVLDGVGARSAPEGVVAAASSNRVVVARACYILDIGECVAAAIAVIGGRAGSQADRDSGCGRAVVGGVCSVTAVERVISCRAF